MGFNSQGTGLMKELETGDQDTSITEMRDHGTGDIQGETTAGPETTPEKGQQAEEEKETAVCLSSKEEEEEI